MEEKKGLVVLRDALGMSAQEFAKDFGVSRATIWKWENGSIPAPTKRKISLKYGIRPTINLNSVLSEEEKLSVYEDAFSYLMGAKRMWKEKLRVGGETLSALSIPGKDYGSEEESKTQVDCVLAEVKEAFMRDEPSTDARIRIIVDALHLIIDDK